jgi:predicted DNA-binding transcriptional regulator YafY
VQLTYAPGDRPRTIRVAEPLGMVSKAGVWYLVGQVNGRRLVYRADRIVQAELLDGQFRRPADFDLVRFWDEWSRDFEASRPKVTATVRIHPALWVTLPEIFGDAVRSRMEAATPPDENAWRQIELSFESLAAAKSRILGLGPQAIVLEPADIREAAVGAAAQVVEMYGR